MKSLDRVSKKNESNAHAEALNAGADDVLTDQVDL